MRKLLAMLLLCCFSVSMVACAEENEDTTAFTPIP